MSHAYFGYIGRPFVDISGVLNTWCELSEKFLVYEHTPDDGCTYRHCHILALGIQLDTKQLYKRKDFRGLGLDGTKKQFGFQKYEEGKETIEYMSKGMFDPVINKGFDDNVLTLAKSKGYSKKEKPTKEEKEISQWELLRNDFHTSRDDPESTIKPTLYQVRKFVMRWYYKRTGLMPHASNYKRYVSTLYYEAVVEASKKNPTCNSPVIAMDEIMDWAY